MLNLYDRIISLPDFYRQLRCSDSLITQFNCPLTSKYQDLWSHFNYLIYVIEGRKIWHTPQRAYDLRKGDCVFVRKGACIVEQFFESATCYIFFFIPDDFICEVLQDKLKPVAENTITGFEPIIPVDNNELVQSFFQSMVPYFSSDREPNNDLLELKFRELVLTLADNDANADLYTYFSYLLKQPQALSLQQVMEENFCFNLKLEEFARLSARSLAAFKRNFQAIYQTSPGKWLLEKRLNHALHLLTNIGKSVSDASFESGFESASHFSRAFRQRFGHPPTAAKQQTTI